MGEEKKRLLVENLLKLVELTAPRKGRFLVHCSAGVGRTGTYCAVLDAYRTGKRNVFDIIKHLRHPDTGRVQMVQNHFQYELVYDAVALISASLPSRVWSLVWRNNRA